MKKQKSMRKTGILGGTFDPIHNGHIQMALTAAEEYDLDEVWLMPNGSPPHKNDRLITAKPSERLAMTELAIKDCRQEMGEKCPLVLCDYEIKRRRTSYSYETMEHFNDLYPDREFYFIIGADSLMDLTLWMEPERLVKTCILLAAVRYGTDEGALKKKIGEYHSLLPGCDIRLLHMPQIDVSATEIRQRLKKNKSVDHLIPASVSTYIKNHPSLYA